MLASDVYLMQHTKMSFDELIPWLLSTAILQEAHHFHSANWPDWVPGAGKFREHADILSRSVKAAENRDREMV
ncbi:MAG TPA: fibronectin type III domain-containing protein, partial [Geobacter sp.]|nr:fibronectin type III domain-containing protein [Geobacter sp.]